MTSLPIRYPALPCPSPLTALRELRTPLDAIGAGLGWLTLPRVRAERPRHVLLVPGLGVGEASMAMIGRHLRRCGHHVHGWGLGRNTGDAPELLELLHARVGRLVEQVEEPLVAVGWSLGGFLARELARDRPERFERVVTLGSPVIGGAKVTSAAPYFRQRGYDLDAIERQIAARYEVPLRVPVVAIYSKRDGVVAWEACIDRWSPHVRHVEVSETHVGLGFSPRALRVVAEAVAAPPPVSPSR